MTLKHPLNIHRVASRWYFPLYLSLLSVLLGVAGCFGDVAHDNPFDPRSDDFSPAARVEGIIMDRTDRPLAGVQVKITLTSSASILQSSTDQQGRYSFDRVVPGTYQLFAEKQGFAAAIDSISVDGFGGVSKNYVLNGAPQFDEVQIRTAHINRVWPPPTDFTLLEVMAHVSDMDGNIDLEKAWLEVDALGVSDTLMFTQEAGVFKKDLNTQDLGVGSMQSILGEELVLKARDRLGHTSETSPLKVARIIAETPVVASPQAGTVLSEVQPMLTWLCQAIPYTFSYRVEVVRVDDVVRNSVTVLDNLDPNALCVDQPDSNQQEATIQVDIPLSVGSYFWTVAIVDDFGNWSRSKEAGFVIN